MLSVFLLVTACIISCWSLRSLSWTNPSSPTLSGGKRYAMICGTYNESIWLLGGGTSYFGTNDVIHYNVPTQTFTELAPITDNIRSFSQPYTTINTTIYIYTLSDHPFIAAYNMHHNTYNNESIPKHSAIVTDSCLTSVYSYLLVLGGAIGNAKQNGFYIFDLLNNIWIEDGPVLDPARGELTCQAHKNGYLYAIGGAYASGASGVLDTVSVIDITHIRNITNNSWITLNDTLNTPRYTLSSVIYDTDIFVIGGNPSGGASLSDEVDVIDTITNTISLNSLLVNRGFAFAVTVFNGLLYVFGGFGNGDYYDTIQYAVVAPTASPTEAPTNSPSLSPTQYPSFSPTLSPSFVPSFSPSVSPSNAPSRYPTRSDMYPYSLGIEYFFGNLTASNVGKYQNDIISIIENEYVYISALYSNSDSEWLQYRYFQIVFDEFDETVSQQNEQRNAVIEASIKYTNDSDANLISFISTKSLFRGRVENALRDLFGVNEVVFFASIIQDIAIVSEPVSKPYFVYAMLSFMSLMTLISIGAYANNRRNGSIIDDAKWTVLFIIGLQMFDFVSDINLCIEILLQFTTVFKLDLLYISGYGTLIFVIIPYIINISMALKIKEYVSGNNAAMFYIEQRSALFTTLVCLCGSTYAVLQLVSSRLFGNELFNSGLTNFELRNLSKMKLYGSVLSENIPQLGFQLLYIAHLRGTPSNNTLLSFIASLLSIISAVLAYAVNNKPSDCFITQCHLKMSKIDETLSTLSNEEKEKISQNKERKDSWKKELASSIKVPKSSVELGFVTPDVNGCVVHVIHYSFKQQLDSMDFTASDKMSDDRLAKHFIKRLYTINQKEVNVAFNKHFSFPLNTMKVEFMDKTLGSNETEMQLTQTVNNNSSTDVRNKLEIFTQIKRLLDGNRSESEIKSALDNQGYDAQIVDKCISFLNINAVKEETEMNNASIIVYQ